MRLVQLAGLVRICQNMQGKRRSQSNQYYSKSTNCLADAPARRCFDQKSSLCELHFAIRIRPCTNPIAMKIGTSLRISRIIARVINKNEASRVILTYSLILEISRYCSRARARVRAIHDESALGISARSVRADARADLNETESENFSAYQGCPNAATRINTHATIVIDIQRATTVDPPCGRGKREKKKKKPAAADNDEEEEEEEREEETEMKKERRLCRWYIQFLTLKERSCKIPIVVQDYLQFFWKGIRRRRRRRRRYGGAGGARRKRRRWWWRRRTARGLCLVFRASVHRRSRE